MALAKWFELMQKYPELKLTREEIECMTEEQVKRLFELTQKYPGLTREEIKSLINGKNEKEVIQEWHYRRWYNHWEKIYPDMKRHRESAERIEPSLDRVLEILTGIKITYKYIKREK